MSISSMFKMDLLYNDFILHTIRGSPRILVTTGKSTKESTILQNKFGDKYLRLYVNPNDDIKFSDMNSTVVVVSKNRNQDNLGISIEKNSTESTRRNKNVKRNCSITASRNSLALFYPLGVPPIVTADRVCQKVVTFLEQDKQNVVIISSDMIRASCLVTMLIKSLYDRPVAEIYGSVCSSLGVRHSPISSQKRYLKYWELVCSEEVDCNVASRRKHARVQPRTRCVSQRDSLLKSIYTPPAYRVKWISVVTRADTSKTNQVGSLKDDFNTTNSSSDDSKNISVELWSRSEWGDFDENGNGSATDYDSKDNAKGRRASVTPRVSSSQHASSDETLTLEFPKPEYICGDVLVRVLNCGSNSMDSPLSAEFRVGLHTTFVVEHERKSRIRERKTIEKSSNPDDTSGPTSNGITHSDDIIISFQASALDLNPRSTWGVKGIRIGLAEVSQKREDAYVDFLRERKDQTREDASGERDSLVSTMMKFRRENNASSSIATFLQSTNEKDVIDSMIGSADDVLSRADSNIIEMPISCTDSKGSESTVVADFWNHSISVMKTVDSNTSGAKIVNSKASRSINGDLQASGKKSVCSDDSLSLNEWDLVDDPDYSFDFEI